MKIAVLASREEASRLVPVLHAFRELGIPAFALSFAPAWQDLERQKLLGNFEGATHFLIVTDSKSSGEGWFAFAAGIASTRRNGLSLLRLDPGWELPRYLRGWPVFEDLEELKTFFRSMRGEWELEEARHSARASLLALGISFHSESLAACVTNGEVAAVKLFVEAGFNPDLRNAHGVPLLCLAARSRHQAVAEILLEAGANIDLQSEDRGYTALMDAAKLGPAEHVEFFLERGADPDIASKDGQTALIIAVGRRDLPVSRLLLEHGADPDSADKLGMSARAYAKLFKLPDFLELFEAYPPRA